MPDDLSRTVFSDLGRALGIEGLAPEADGSCRLVFDGNRLVEMNASRRRSGGCWCRAASRSRRATAPKPCAC
jgi:hypothetical protein